MIAVSIRRTGNYTGRWKIIAAGTKMITGVIAESAKNYAEYYRSAFIKEGYGAEITWYRDLDDREC